MLLSGGNEKSFSLGRRHKPVNQSRDRCIQVVSRKGVDAEIGANFAGNARSEFEKYHRKRSEWLRPTDSTKVPLLWH